MQSNADYAEWFRGRPKRLRLPLQAPRLAPVAATLLADVGCETPTIHYALCNGRLVQMLVWDGGMSKG